MTVPDVPGQKAGLADRLTRAPLPHDPDRARSVLADLDMAGLSGAAQELLAGAAGSSPYLARLIQRHAATLHATLLAPPEQSFATLCAELAAAETEAGDVATLSERLRQAKSRAALLIALADLGGVWDLGEVTGALTQLADLSVTTAARWLLRKAIERGKLPGARMEDMATGAGLIVLAMGKMGARELNYSSDIDLIVLFDDSRFGADDVLEARAAYIRITRDLVKLLSENTAHGYVFRTDLRLRPAPSTTPVCMAASAAERYYETVGRTWERAAHIKARPLIDTAAGARYLEALAPFVWRRHLDYAAIEDTQGMLDKIRRQKASFTVGAIPGHDLKLGPGGIREIEFFAQTRQMIVGGRDPGLRQSTTLGALQALTEGGWIEPEVRVTLSDAYVKLRTIEHRLQMIEDAQTHSVPKSDAARARLAALYGAADLATFERGLVDCLARVHGTCDAFFSPKEDTARPAPASSETALADAGFARPEDAARRIARWRQAGIPATRSERAQALFSRLEPQIVARLARAADPDQALAHFDRFLGGLPAGVQVFSLFTANPQLLDLIVEICTAAPRLASYLGRHPQTLDALVEQDFWQPLPPLEGLEEDLAIRLRGIDDYEWVLDETRRWAREHWFRAGVHVLRGLSDHEEAGLAFTRIAEAFISGLLPHVTRDFASRHGLPPGEGLVVLAMGKLGSCEMTAGSDLDLITIYSGGEEPSDGPRPLPPRSYYPRLTQALIAALTAPTAEGALYEVDMRLRPSGRSGPVAVSLPAFERYQTQEAWVWEHMALTRGRAIAGPRSLRMQVSDIMATALASRQDQDEVLGEAAEMRVRLVEAHAALRTNPWSLKHAKGGLMEVEFLLQALNLRAGGPWGRPTREALEWLKVHEVLSPSDAASLGAALALLQPLQQIERVALETAFDPDTMGEELRRVCARVSGLENLEQITARLVEAEAEASAVVDRLLPLPAPGG